MTLATRMSSTILLIAASDRDCSTDSLTTFSVLCSVLTTAVIRNMVTVSCHRIVIVHQTVRDLSMRCSVYCLVCRISLPHPYFLLPSECDPFSAPPCACVLPVCRALRPSTLSVHLSCGMERHVSPCHCTTSTCHRSHDFDRPSYFSVPSSINFWVGCCSNTDAPPLRAT